MQKGTFAGVVVVVAIGLVLFFGRKGSYFQFVQTKLHQPIKAIEFQPSATSAGMIKVEDPNTLAQVGEWLKTLKKAELLSGGDEPVCPMILYMEDGSTLNMKISPTVLSYSGIKIADPVNVILVSWNGYTRSGENIFQNFLSQSSSHRTNLERRNQFNTKNPGISPR